MSRKSRLHHRLTGVGWMFLAISLTVGLAAIKTQVSLLFLIFGSMLGAMLASVVMARHMVLALGLRREVTDRVWQSQRAYLGYYLRSQRWQGPCLGIRVEEIGAEGLAAAAGYCLQLPAGQVFRAGGRFLCHRRGRLDLRRIRVSTTFPFGLIRVYRHLDQQARLLVWPARGHLKRQLLTRGAVEISRNAPSAASGGQDEFFGLREYREDDNPRWIHWRRSAGRILPVVREMARPLPEVLWIVLDCHWPKMAEPQRQQREKMIRFAATLADYALNREYQVGLAVAGASEPTILRPAGGLAQRRALLDGLALIGNSVGPLDQVLIRLSRAALAKAQVLAISPEATPQAAETLSTIGHCCRQLSILGPEELDEVFLDQPPLEEAK